MHVFQAKLGGLMYVGEGLVDGISPAVAALGNRAVSHESVPGA